MNRLALFAGAVGVATGAALVLAPTSQAADHLDAPTISMSANAMADLNDVFAWTTSDASKVNLAMTVSPADDGTHSFGPAVQYVFHVTSRTQFGMNGTETQVICTFTNNTAAKCWVARNGTTIDYVTGDPSAAAGITSASGKVRLFAGKRSDPFFFNFLGFEDAVSTVKTLANGLTPDAAGCPADLLANGTVLATKLQETPTAASGPCPANAKDCFANLNVMAIVLQIDKDELNVSTNKLISVWASTHMPS